MDGGSGWFEVVVLAAIAGFVAWRLFSVLGSRTGHEAPPVERRPLADDPRDIFAPNRHTPAKPAYAPEPRTLVLPDSMSPELQTNLQAIAAVDPRFDPKSFLSGANAAYGLILAHFWQGEADALKAYLGDDAYFAFAQAINARPESQKILPSRLENILSADIIAAELVGATAHVTVRFVANIATDGDTRTATDDWTFSRHTRSDDPNWLLIATDDNVGA